MLRRARPTLLTFAPAAVAVALGMLGGLQALTPSGAMIALGLVAAATAILVTLHRPMWGLYLMIVLLPIRATALTPRLPVIDIQFLPYRVLLAAVFLTLILRAPKDSLKRVLWSPLTPPMLVLMGLGLLTTFFAPERSTQIKALFQMAMCFGVYAAIPILVNTEQKYRSVCKLIATVGVVYACYGVVDYVLYLKGFPSNTRATTIQGTIAPPRTNGVCDDPNIYIFRILPALCLVPTWAATLPRKTGRLLWFGTLAVLVALLPATASRGSMVALVLLFATVGVLAIRGRRGWLADANLRRLWLEGAGLTVLLSLFLVALVAIISPLLVLRAKMTFTGATMSSGRVPVYQATVTSSARHPLGRGLGLNVVRGDDPLPHVTHNTLLQVMAEMGYPGLLTYLWLLAVTAGIAWRMPRGSPLTPWMGGIVLGLLAAYYSSIFLSYYFDENMTLLWGMLVAGGWLTGSLHAHLPQPAVPAQPATITAAEEAS
jgi:hypothetical protein